MLLPWFSRSSSSPPTVYGVKFIIIIIVINSVVKSTVAYGVKTYNVNKKLESKL